ncbi:MAG: hypothetical protein MUF31_00330 [Akkermansiaceae bacterium]|jgi:ABC-type multidrug transport system ATPase subunit|nr:hypothetical protein [Akkermansiaceae bacterium]
MKELPERDSGESGVVLRLGRGLAIGYEKKIAEVPDELKLGGGTHFLLARNGRGKTTLLKTISGLLKRLGGEYEVSGRCSFVADDLAFDRELSPRLIFAAFLNEKGRAAAAELSDRIELDVKKPFGKLSFGNRKKVGVVVAECGRQRGDVVLYDEPFTGLDTPAREALLARWEETCGEITRLVSCHPDLDEMAMPSALLISDGRIGRPGDGAASWADLKRLLK